MNTSKKPPPGIIVLGAGQGSRFSGPGHKLAQMLGNRPVLAQTVQQALSTGLPVTLVTTEPLAALVQGLLPARNLVVLPPVGSAEGLGMGRSIAAGVGAMPNAGGWLVTPGDMPFIRRRTIEAVARALQGQAVVYAQYQGRRGHPVGFSAELYTELATLTGDDGAKRIVARYPAMPVEVDDPGVLADLDTVEDLDRARGELPVWLAAQAADQATTETF